MKVKLPRRTFAASIIISIIILGIFLWIVMSELAVTSQQIISSGLSALILVTSVIMISAIAAGVLLFMRYLYQQKLKKDL